MFRFLKRNFMDFFLRVVFHEILLEKEVHPPLSYPHRGGLLVYIRERGIPERINQNSLGVMVARGLWATPSCRVVSCRFRGVPCLPLLGGKDEQDMGRKTRGGRCPYGCAGGVFQTNTGTCSPRLCVKCSFCKIFKEIQLYSRTLNPKFPARNKSVF